MMLFFNRIGLERLGVVGPEPGLLWTGLKALDRRAGDKTTGSGCGTVGLQALNFAKTRKKKRPAGASPVVAPMPKSVSF